MIWLTLQQNHSGCCAKKREVEGDSEASGLSKLRNAVAITPQAERCQSDGEEKIRTFILDL